MKATKSKPTSHKPTNKKVFTVIHCTEHQTTLKEYKNTKTFKAFEDDIIFWGTANHAKVEIAKMISLTK